MPPALTARFFARDADQVARALLGQLLVHETDEGRASLRVNETEAYFGPPGMNRRFLRRRDAPEWLKERLRAEGDPAAHSFRGPTPRNRPMYGPPGRAYVYLIYGVNECMNVVTGADGDPQAVLLRAGEPVEGRDLMVARRGSARARDLATGPGKLAKALHVTRAWSGRSLVEPGSPLRFERGRRVPDGDVVVTPRINVVGAEDLPLRYVVRGSPTAPRASAAVQSGTRR